MNRAIDLAESEARADDGARGPVIPTDMMMQSIRLLNLVDAAVSGGRLYAVTSERTGSAALAERLRKAPGSNGLPVDIVMVDTIPRTASGAIDDVALRRVPPVGTSLVARLADKMNIRATLERRTLPVPLRHIDDMAGDHPLLGERYGAVTLEGLTIPATAPGMRPSRVEGAAVAPMGETIDIASVLERTASGANGIRFVSEDGVKRVSYRDFRDNVLRYAAALRGDGFAPGNSVILCRRGAEEFITAFWACLHAGVTAIPLRPPRLWSQDDPVARRFCHMYALLDGPAVLADAADQAGIRALLDTAGLRPPRMAATAGDAPGEAAAAHVWPAAQPAMITFTSGSTGLPKGVPLSAANLVSTPLNLQVALDLGASDTLLSIMTLDHAGSLVGFCGAAIWSGAELVVAPLDPVLAEPARLIDWLEREGITHSWAPDFLWQLLARAAGENERLADLSRLKALISGGESVRRETFVTLKQALVRHGVTGDILRTAWGMSETTSFMTLSAPWNDRESHALKGGILDNGRPLGGNAFRIVDADGNLLPEPACGRLQARGVSVFAGYSKNEERSHSDDGWMTTGDLAEMHDGRTIICGREKEMLIVNGQNIPQVEIEGQIERLPGILPRHVVAVATRNLLTGLEELVIFAVPAESDLPDAERAALIGRISGAVAGFCGARPAHVLLVERSDIPKTGIGKLQRTSLRKAFEQGAFDRHIRENDILLQSGRMIFTAPCRPIWVNILPDEETRSLRGRSFLVLGPLDALAARLFAAGGKILASPDDISEGDGDLTVIDGRALTCADRDGLHTAIGDLAGLPDTLGRKGASRAELIVLTRGGFFLPGDDPASLPTGEVLLGAINALSSEHPGLTVGLIDIAADSRPEIVLPWIGSGIPGKALALREGRWMALRLERLPASAREKPVPGRDVSFLSGDVVLVVGGLGRIGRHLTRRLAIAGGCRIIVAGRRARAQVAAELAAIVENAADRIGYVQADICDAADVGRLFDAAREIHGRTPSIVLNLSGETGRSPLATIDTATIDRFLAARLDGIANLTRSFAAEGGGTLVSLGSAFTCIGTHDHLARLVGEAALAGAASRLTMRNDTVRQVCLVSAPWITEDQPPGFGDYLRRQGLYPVTPLQGLAGLLEILDGTNASGVVTLGIDAAAPAWAAFAAGTASGVEVITVRSEADRDRCAAALADLFPGLRFPIALNERPAEADAGAAQGPVGLILRIWRDVLGGERPFHPEQNFFDAGGTSIAATKVHAQLLAAGYRTLGLIDIFVHPTPNALAAFLGRDGAASTPAGESLLDDARRRQARRQTARRERRPAALRS